MTPQAPHAPTSQALLVRRATLVLLLLIGPVTSLAVWVPTPFGLDRSEALLLGPPAILLNAAVLWWLRHVTDAAVARRRVLPLALALVGVAAAGIWLSSGTPISVLFGLAMFLVFSALVFDAWALTLVTVTAIGLTATASALTGELDADLVAGLAFLAGIAMLTRFATSTLNLGIIVRDAAIVDAARARRALEAVIIGLQQSASSDPDRIVHAAADSAARLVGGWAIVLLHDHGALRSVAEAGNRRAGGSSAVDRLAATAVATGRVVASTPLDGEETAVLEATGSSWVAAVPITPRDPAGGALVAGRSGSDQPPPHTDELEALRVLAEHTGLALHLAEEAAGDRRAAARLADLDRMKDGVVTTVSHELRTPVTIMTGLAETLAQRGELDADVRAELLHRLWSNGVALKHIVEQLLDAALARQGALEIELRDVSVSAIVHACVERLDPLLATHRITVEVDHCHVVADPALLERVIENLLVNAIRHTPRGTRVAVRATSTGGDVEIEVSDDGPGIAAHEVERILDRFERGGDVNDRARGLGIGLALTGDILRQHDTVLRVSSATGRGANFSFRLPRPESRRVVGPVGVRL